VTLKSALQDIKETTLSAISGLLGQLVYLASLRRAQGCYQHWGMEAIHGQESSKRALRAAHSEVVTEVLRMPLESLTEDLEQSCRNGGLDPQSYVEQMRACVDDLLPEGKQNTPTSTHLNSVLVALSCLERNRERATPSTS
jgi:hypothetical protein